MFNCDVKVIVYSSYGCVDSLVDVIVW